MEKQFALLACLPELVSGQELQMNETIPAIFPGKTIQGMLARLESSYRHLAENSFGLREFRSSLVAHVRSRCLVLASSPIAARNQS